MCVCVCVCVCVCACVHACVHACVCVHVCYGLADSHDATTVKKINQPTVKLNHTSPLEMMQYSHRADYSDVLWCIVRNKVVDNIHMQSIGNN